MTPFGAPAPRWLNIEAGRPFLKVLAAGLLEALTADGPDNLAAATVLAPTRRACRELAAAFLEAAGGAAVLLPQIRALGDLDESEPPFEAAEAALDLPPAIAPARRRYELARLAAELEAEAGRAAGATGALALADALAHFLQGAEIEEIDPAGAMAALAPDDLARHWRISADLLERVMAEWPRRLEALGLMDADARRVALLRRLAAGWRERPPSAPVIAAGSTGSAPAVAELLTTIAALPQGCVVLPGLDLDLADLAWAEIGEDHPQASMKRLIERAGVARAEVRPWEPRPDARGRWRRRLINESLRPARATADWLSAVEALRAEGRAGGVDPIAEGLCGLALVAARSEEEAATCAALALREALETPGRTAALVTPDACLARRVSARLTRWGIAADSSAGRPLALFPIGTLTSLVARLGFNPLDPVLQLALAKHPLARFGHEAGALREARWALEIALRGPPKTGWDEIVIGEEGQSLLQRLRAASERLQAPFAGGAADVGEAAGALASVMQEAAADAEGGFGGLWGGADGETAAALLAGLIDDGGALPPVTAAGFAELIERLVAGEIVRGGASVHPRLRILGALEARLIHVDRLVVAGLEEGVWPQAPPADPFLSRPMRQALGLPPPERRLGLAAHDYAQAACAPEVVLIAADRRQGAPAVASRWLWRLQTLARGAGVALPGRPEILAAARALDAPASFDPAPRPCPKPPVASRPRRLGVTRVETWLRDPYAIYAHHVLGLRPLDRPGEPVEAMARGTAVHRAFERFATLHPGPLPTAAERAFSTILIECLAEAGIPPHRLARERALAENVAPWVIDFERRRRGGAGLLVEQQGELAFEAPAGAFTVTAKADRIELRGTSADVLDFKTGAPPSKKQVTSGLAPQLTLTAAILAAGGFAEAGPVRTGELVYVRVSGGRTPGRIEIRAGADESAEMARAALDGLKRRVAAFDRPETGYIAWATPQFMGRWGGDYDHLARLWEWGVIGAQGEEAP